MWRPGEVNPEAGGAGASSRQPVIVRYPLVNRYQPNFIPSRCLLVFELPATSTLNIDEVVGCHDFKQRMTAFTALTSHRGQIGNVAFPPKAVAYLRCPEGRLWGMKSGSRPQG